MKIPYLEHNADIWTDCPTLDSPFDLWVHMKEAGGLGSRHGNAIQSVSIKKLSRRKPSVCREISKDQIINKHTFQAAT